MVREAINLNVAQESQLQDDEEQEKYPDRLVLKSIVFLQSTEHKETR